MSFLVRHCGRLRRSRVRYSSFIFLFNYYSHATHLDHGEIMYSPFPVRCPRGGGTLQAPLLPSARLQSPLPAPPTTPAAPPPTPRSLRLPLLAPSFPRPWFLFLFIHTRMRLKPHVRGGEEVQYRPPSPLICQEVPHLPPVLPPPSLLPHLRPQGHLLGFPLRTHLEEVLPSLVRVPAPPALRGGPILRPIEVLLGQAMPRLDLVEPRGKPFSAPSHRAVRPLAASPLVRLPPLLL